MDFKNLFKKNYANKLEYSIKDSKDIVDESIIEDDIAKDLMILIGQAIDEWVKRNSLETLPKYIVFEQALAIMNAWKKSM